MALAALIAIIIFCLMCIAAGMVAFAIVNAVSEAADSIEFEEDDEEGCGA